MGERREAEEGGARRREAFWGGEGGGGEVEERGRGGECSHCWMVLLVVLWFDWAKAEYDQAEVWTTIGSPLKNY